MLIPDANIAPESGALAVSPPAARAREAAVLPRARSLLLRVVPPHVRARLGQGLAEVEQRLERRLGDVRADLIKWMFIFWAGSTVATVTLVVTFVGLLVRRT